MPIFDGSVEDATEFCLAAIESRSGARVATANLDFLALARKDADLRGHLENSTLVVADGLPVAWLARLMGAARTRRVPGVDLVQEICRVGAARGGLRVALYGSDVATAARARRWLEQSFPGVRVVLTLCPPFRPLTEPEQRRERRQFAGAAPELVLVALGCPKQERLIAHYFASAPHAVWLGVGGTLDFFARTRRRAPRALQSTGLEWLVRLLQEPRRLWRRYLLRDIPALIALTPSCVLARLRGDTASVAGPR